MEQYFRRLLSERISAILPKADVSIEVSIPQNPEHGDLATNAALQLAKIAGKPPRQIASEIVEGLVLDTTLVDSVTIAGPGFINIRYTAAFYQRELASILAAGADFGKTTGGAGKKVNVEWVSANPTGKLHAGHGRQVCLGAAITNLLEWTGQEVTREYYFNNAGNQMRKLAESVRIRYLQTIGEPVELPEDGYHGVEIIDIAAEIFKQFEDTKRDAPDEFFQKFGEQYNFEAIKTTLERLGVKHDIFFNEQSLYDNGSVAALIETLKSKDLAYEHEGAVWLRLTAMGMEQDRVIVKSTGEPTYRLPDICYHIDKLSRGYDHIIDIFGADHIATIPDVLATVGAMGYDSHKVKVIIHQMVSFVAGKELVKFSKRSGGNYTLDELLDDVGADAAKFFFNMRAVGSHLEFDIQLAQEQSEKNPVYYVQYAHARIASILRFAVQQGIDISQPSSADLSLLTHPEEIDLIKQLRRLPQIIAQSAEAFAPHHVCEYLREVAAGFHKFYHDCRIVGESEGLQSARLALAVAAKQTLASGCAVLGVSAPESM
jgi:arginyl-tRNA synthetase